MNDKFRNHKHTISFRHAIEGVILAIKTQPNFKIISLFACLALILSIALKLNYLEWIVIVWTITIVYVAEMINTSIESMIDLITIEWREDAKIAKDISSGMVLITVLSAFITGIIIFLPKILSY